MLVRWEIPIFNVALALLLFWAVGSESRDIRPSDHGLSNQTPTTQASPAMKSFFKGSSDVALPVARNSSDPFWGIAGTITPASFGPVGDGQGRVRKVLLIASLACGAVGVATLIAVAAVYLFRARRTK